MPPKCFLRVRPMPGRAALARRSISGQASRGSTHSVVPLTALSGTLGAVPGLSDGSCAWASASSWIRLGCTAESVLLT